MYSILRLPKKMVSQRNDARNMLMTTLTDATSIFLEMSPHTFEVGTADKMTNPMNHDDEPAASSSRVLVQDSAKTAEPRKASIRSAISFMGTVS